MLTLELQKQAGEFDRLRKLSEDELTPALKARCRGNAALGAHVLRLIESDRHLSGGS